MTDDAEVVLLTRIVQPLDAFGEQQFDGFCQRRLAGTVVTVHKTEPDVAGTGEMSLAGEPIFVQREGDRNIFLPPGVGGTVGAEATQPFKCSLQQPGKGAP
jgi:hypothetical protein